MPTGPFARNEAADWRSQFGVRNVDAQRWTMGPQDHLNPYQFGSMGVRQQLANQPAPSIRLTGSGIAMSASQAAQTFGGTSGLRPPNGVSQRQYENTISGQLINQNATSNASYQGMRWNQKGGF